MPKNLSASTTYQPDSQLQYASRKRLSAKEWNDLAIDLMGGVQAALADRKPLEQNINDGNNLYEMLSDKDPNWPVVNAADVFVPLIPTQLESMLAYIAAQVLVPHPFIVTGNTQQAAQTAHLVERFYNAEFKRQRGDTTWFEQFVDWLHFSLRDGTGFVEVLWKYKKTKKRVDQFNPRMETDELTQELAPVLDDDGKPVYDKLETEIEDTHNAVQLRAVQLRNVITVPAAATSIEEAVAVIKVEYLMEDQLMELVNDGVLDKEEVEKALQMVPAGTTELPNSPQPTEVYTAGDQVGLGAAQGTQTSKFFRNRGPVEVYRIHSRQYDLDNDGTPEENVFWVHRSTWRMLGWMRYQYFNGLRPFFPFSPYKRPGELLGFALPIRLAGLQNEINAQRNQRLDEGNIRLSPPFVVKKGSSLADSDMAWGANQRWEADDPQTDFQRIQMEQVPQFSYMEEQMINKDAQDYTGLANPMIGQQSSGRRSAQEAKQWQAASMTRSGMIAMRFRMAIRPVVNFIHALNKQYLTTDQDFTVDQTQFTLPLPVLNQDYSIDVAGTSDPIDAVSRRTETMGAADVFMKFPSIASNPLRQFYLLRKIAETFNWADMDQIIGTEADAIGQMQQMAAQAAQGEQPGQPPPQQQQPPKQ